MIKVSLSFDRNPPLTLEAVQVDVEMSSQGGWVWVMLRADWTVNWAVVPTVVCREVNLRGSFRRKILSALAAVKFSACRLHETGMLICVALRRCFNSPSTANFILPALFCNLLLILRFFFTQTRVGLFLQKYHLGVSYVEQTGQSVLDEFALVLQFVKSFNRCKAFLTNRQLVPHFLGECCSGERF